MAGSGKKILMLVGDFVEDYEVMVPFQMLVMLGHPAWSREFQKLLESI